MLNNLFISRGAGDINIEGDAVTTPKLLRVVNGVPVLVDPPKPLPTVPGLYKPYDQPAKFRMLKLTQTGKWFWCGFYDQDDEECGDPEAYRNTMILVWEYK